MVYLVVSSRDGYIFRAAGWGWGGGRQVVDDLRTEVCGQQKQSNDPRNNHQNPNMPTTGRANGTSCHIQHSPGTPTMGLREWETTSAGAPAAAADRKQRPDATCEGKNG